MAAIVERTAADAVTDALRNLDDVERYARDLRAHLDNARRQGEPAGTLGVAARVAGIVSACAVDVRMRVSEAWTLVVTPHE